MNRPQVIEKAYFGREKPRKSKEIQTRLMGQNRTISACAKQFQT